MVYVLPVIALLLSFLAFISSVRFLFTRQGFVWILPILISLVISYWNLTNLLYAGEYGDELGSSITINSIIPFLLSFLWYVLVIVFHFVIKDASKENKYRAESIRNRNEAIFMEKYEERRRAKERRKKEEEALSIKKPEIPLFRFPEETA